MRGRLGTPTFLAALLAAAPLPAAPSSPLELVRGLRNEGMPDLALKYLDDVAAKLSPAETKVLPLERAKLRLDLAQQESDEAKRARAYADALAGFDQFRKANPAHPLAPQATLEIARLTSARASDELSKARARGKEKLDAEAPKALAAYDSAAKTTGEALKLIDAQLAKASDADPSQRRELEKAKEAAGLELGVALYRKEAAYDRDRQRKERADAITAAKKAFDAVAAQESESPARWVARAYSARCDDLNDMSLPETAKKYTELLSDPSPAAEAGKRLALYFRVRQVVERQSQTDPAAVPQAVTLAVEWLRRFNDARDTPEGRSVRMSLGQLYRSLAQRGVTIDPKTKRPGALTTDARQNLAQAERLFADLAGTENEFTDRADTARMEIILVRSRVDKKGNISELSTFEECYLAAQVELAEFAEFRRANKDNDDAISKERTNRYQRVSYALERAQQFAPGGGDGRDARDLLDARLLLAYTYLELGQHPQAALLAEYVARTTPTDAAGSQRAAVYALNAYNVLLEAARGSDRALPPEFGVDKARLKSLARHLSAHPAAAVADRARHVAGALHLEDGNYYEAAQSLAALAPNYEGVAVARYQQAKAALMLQNMEPNSLTDETVAQLKARKVTGPERVRWLAGERARVSTATQKQLDALPMPGPSEPPDSAQFTLLAKLQKAYLLLGEAQALAALDADGGPKFAEATARYRAIEALAKAVEEQLPKSRTIETKSPQNYSDLQKQAAAVQLLAVQGLAFVESRKGEHAKAVELTAPAVAQVRAGLAKADEGTESAAVKELRTRQQGVVSQALSSSVQAGQVEKADELVDLMEKLAAKSGDVSAARGALSKVVRDVTNLVNDSKRSKDSQLAQILPACSQFLERLSKKEGLAVQAKVDIAQGFMAIDNHAKAADVLASVPAPAGDATTDEGRQAKRNFEGVQILRLQALRAGNKLAEAEKLCDGLLKGWAARNFVVQKERIFIMEDKGTLQAASAEWLKMFKSVRIPPRPALSPEDAQDPDKDAKYKAALHAHDRARELSFELRFYIVRLPYQAARKSKSPEFKVKALARTAADIVKVEKEVPDMGGEAVKKMYLDLLNSDAELKQAYQKAGGASFPEA